MDILMNPKRSFEVSLWSINRWLRWTGVRLVVTVDMTKDLPTNVGLGWYGWTGASNWSLKD